MSVLYPMEQLYMSITIYDIYIIITLPRKTQMMSPCTTNRIHLHTLTKADIGYACTFSLRYVKTSCILMCM